MAEDDSDDNYISVLENDINRIDNDISDFYSATSFFKLFNKANAIFLTWFLAIYLVAYFVLGSYFNKGNTASTFQVALGRMLDFIFIGIFVIGLCSTYFTSTESDREQLWTDTLSNIKTYFKDPYSLPFNGLFLFLFYTVIYLFRVPMTIEAKPISLSFIEMVAWLLLLINSIISFFKYALGISIVDMFTGSSTIDSSYNLVPVSLHFAMKNDTPAATQAPTPAPTPAPAPPAPAPPAPAPPAPTPTPSASSGSGSGSGSIKASTGNEVFNVSDNLYTYDDAQAICKSYGATMATYDQIESAYNDGAEWCNYGWSDDQMIFFPTQKSTWDKLQKVPEHKNDCGRPGVNGGYIANPYIKFGVNCFGKKPPASDDDLVRMNSKQNMLYPKSQKDINLEKKVNYWKDNAASLLKVNSFNNKKWSEY